MTVPHEQKSHIEHSAQKEDLPLSCLARSTACLPPPGKSKTSAKVKPNTERNKPSQQTETGPAF